MSKPAAYARTETLNAADAGITRLRTKGGAPQRTLYDLVNAYVTKAKTIRPRPGSGAAVDLPEGTIGLTLVNGVFNVFASSNVGAMPAGYELNILTHPSDPLADLVEIHAAFPFLGILYVVAEWSDDPTIAYHYWLEKAPAWQPDTVYGLDAVVQPTVPNGYSYRAKRLNPPGTVWQPNVPRTVGDVVEPTTFTGWVHTVIETIGDSPRSGTTEPSWSTANGGLTIEDTDTGSSGTTPPPQSGGNNPPPLPPDVDDRYAGAPWRAVQEALQ